MNNNLFLCWDAPKKGAQIIIKTLKAFKEEKVEINSVLYLICEHNYLDESYIDQDKQNSKERLKNIKFQIEQEKIEFQHIIIDNNSIPVGKADDIQTIEYAIKNNVFPKLLKINPNSINIGLTSGTKEMIFAWISLYATSSFERNFGKNVTLWHFSDDRTKQKTFCKLNIPENRFIENIELNIHNKQKNEINLDITGDVKRNSLINTPMLILGERGTGKTTIVENVILPSKIENKLITKEIIQTIVCGQLDNSLVDDALFGHVKGAFTGAENEKKGAIELAKDGILFLDEIHDLPVSTQRKLLRVLQTHKFTKIGAPENEIECNFQLVCASNLKLSDLQKKLHPDFLDRIAVFITELSPLRELDKHILEALWINRWNYFRKSNFFLSEDPIHFSLVEEALRKSNMYGNIRDIEQLIAYIAREIYNGSLKFSDSAREERIRKAIEQWETDYYKKYPVIHNNNENLSEELLKTEKWDGINKLFKKWLAQEAENIFGSQKEAAKAMSCETKTFRNAKKTI